MGSVKRDWQDIDVVLAYFGKKRKGALKGHKVFMEEGVSHGRKPELVGGGLIRSLGGWSQVLSLRRRRMKVASDERILGSGDFVEGLLSEVERREKETLRLTRKVVSLSALMKTLVIGEGLGESELRSGDRRRGVVKVRRLFCQLAVRRMGYSGAEVARYLGVTTSAVNRLAVSKEHPDLKKYLKLF